MQNNNKLTFIGCDTSYTQSKIVIFGAGYDCTASYRAGARFAPVAIRTESQAIETYSPYQDEDISDLQVVDIGDLELAFGDPVPVLKKIQTASAKILKDKKVPFMIGGEHLVTLAQVKEVAKVYPDLCLIHLDAHTDLRDIYLNSKLSHATVIRRCHDILGDNRIYQFGIRSGEKSEFEWAKSHTHLTKFSLEGIEELAQKLKGKPIYLTLDLDILDPSVFSGTGTPEAGGLTFMELLNGLLCLKGLNIIGLDINELCPPCDLSGVSTVTACKIVRELLLIINPNNNQQAL